jgi:hypothetical protein
MSVWRFAYKGTRLTLGFIALLVVFSHAFMALVYVAVSEYGGPHVLATVAMSLIHLSAICLIMIMSAAVVTGRYDLAKILALAVLAIDIITIVPVLLRFILLSLWNKWLGMAGGLAAPVIIFILVYFMEDLEQASKWPRTVNRRF